MNTLAIDVGGTKFTVAIFEGEHMIRRESQATDREGGRDWMLPRLGLLLRQWKQESRLDRCGIGFGGPVSFETQRVVMSTHAGGWGGFDLPAFVEEIIGVRPIMDNDANAGALGEALYGAGRGYLPLFYMTISTGIGGGIVLSDGSLHRGSDSYAGEIGHLTVRPDGPLCLCGACGCLERMCCVLSLEKDHGRSAKELLQDAAFVRRYVVDLGRGLKAAIMLLNPCRIVIGGGIHQTGPALFLALTE